VATLDQAAESFCNSFKANSPCSGAMLSLVEGRYVITPFSYPFRSPKRCTPAPLVGKRAGANSRIRRCLDRFVEPVQPIKSDQASYAVGILPDERLSEAPPVTGLGRTVKYFLQSSVS
jgi:hypothetical protein